MTHKSRNAPAMTSFYWCLDERCAGDVIDRLMKGADIQPDTGVRASANAGNPAHAGLPVTMSGNVAVVSIDGPLTRSTVYSWWSGEALSTGYDALMQTLQTLMDAPGVRGIVLDINSPGGSVAGVQECADFIARCAAVKPMAAVTNSLCASAAYWLASATGRVYATETAEVGSIGVVMQLVDARKAAEKAGYSVTVMHAGKFKSAGSAYEELSDEAKAYFQNQLDTLHDIFRSAVASHMDVQGDASEWGDAQIFLGRDAATRGLVTAVVGSRDEAVRSIEEDAMAEITMERLMAEAPALADQLRAEGAASVKAPSFEDFMAVASPFIGEEGRKALEGFYSKCTAAGMTMAQMAAMAPMAAPQDKAADEADLRKKILAALKGATPAASFTSAPAPAPAGKTARDYLMEAAEKLGKE